MKMKILKVILLIVVVIIAIILIAALIIKKDYKVEQEIIINKPKQQVFDYVKYVKNQEHYNKWVMMDPNMKKDYKGTDGTAGFVSAWDSDNKNVGKGEQQITNINEGNRIDLQVRFERPFKNTADVYMTTEAVTDNQTKITWVMEGKNPYPMNIMNLFIPGMLGKDLATSLATLKNVLER